MSFHICRRTETIQRAGAGFVVVVLVAQRNYSTDACLSRMSIYNFVPLFSYFSISLHLSLSLWTCAVFAARDFCQMRKLAG